jgi:hypothetical protein
MSNEWHSVQLDPGADPDVSWSLGPGKRYFLRPDGQALLPIVLRLTNIDARQLARSFAGPDKPIVRIPAFYLSPPAFLGNTEYITAIVTENFFSNAAVSRMKLSALVLGPPLFAGTFCAPAALPSNPPTGAPEQGTVVVGVMDDRFAFAHERFRLGNGTTRVEYIWLQDGICDGPGSSVDYGREYRKADYGGDKGIDTLLNDCTTAGFLDEDKLYRLTGVVDFTRDGHKAVARRAAHGTHVLDLACGFDPSDNRQDRPIVCVQLPWRTTADTSGSRLDPFVLDGIRYILDRADRIAAQRNCGPLPVVINFSYGFIAGPHDGTSALEAAIDEIVAKRKQVSTNPPLEIVMPSGNSHLVRARAQVSHPNLTDVVDLSWRLLPDDRTSSFLEIWLPYRPGGIGPTRMHLTITPPGGPTSPQLGELDGSGFAWQPHGQSLCWMIYQFVPAPTSRGRFFVGLLPTHFPDVAGELAPSGFWTVTLHNKSLLAAQLVQAWIQRDDTPFGYPIRGRQSYFDEACYVRFDAQGREIEEDMHPEQVASSCHVKRAGLINALATGGAPTTVAGTIITGAIAVGGYLRKELRFAKYSAGGPITPTRNLPLAPNFRKPDAGLVSDDSKVHFGVLAAGSRSGSLVAINGTSVAAPQLARWIADQLAKVNPGDRAAIGARAHAEEVFLLPAWKPPLLPERGGWGRMLRESAFPRQRYWD